MKNWILAVLVLTLCIGSVVWVLERRVVPRMLLNANAEMLADWRDCLVERKAETGTWPRLGPDERAGFAEDVFVVRGADDRRIFGGYMHGRANLTVGNIPLDVWQTALKFEVTGDNTCRVSSAGPDKTFGTADDMTSDGLKARYTPSTLEEARQKALDKMEKQAGKAPAA